MKKKVLTVLIGSFFITGCGGGTNTNTTNKPLNTSGLNNPNQNVSNQNNRKIGKGTYVDSAINGVRYECGSQIGVTGDTGVAGGFKYEVGKSCLFTINGYGMTAIKATDLSEGVQVKPNLEVARYLQSLDVDGEPDNGIDIRIDVVKALKDKDILGLQQTDAEVHAMVDALSEVSVYHGMYTSMAEAEVHMNGTTSSSTSSSSFSVDISTDKSSYVVGDIVTFNANISGSNENLVYEWKEGDVILGTDSKLNVNNFNIGAHTVNLSVTNIDNVTKNASVVFNVTNATNDTSNMAPFANAGSDMSVTAGTQITFDGSTSYDFDGTIVKYEWIYASRILNSDTSISTYTMNATSVGNHTVILRVTDDKNATSEDQLNVNVTNL